VASRVVGRTDDPYDFPHWQGARIQVVTDPPQDVEGDGEMLGHTPIEATVKPGALRVIVP